MFGDIGAWIFKGIGGIKTDEQAAGFKNVILKPNFVVGLNEFEAKHTGPYGEIISSWKRNGNVVTYKVTVPANSTATIYLPIAAGKKAYSSGKLSTAMVNVPAGQYVYEIR
jgi:alpha-L-rhamnosidase